MSALEIVLLLAGIVIFILSFVMPLGSGGLSQEAGELAKEEIKILVTHEVDGAKKRIGDAADNAVDHAMDKTERALERISNEKIMAVNEYSDTVLKEINKNHEEVLFLYDMLNDKHTSLKNTVAKVGEVVKAVRETIGDAEAATAAYRQEREGIETAAGSFDQFKRQAEVATENFARLKQEAENAMGSYKQLKGETEALMSSLGQIKRETEATMRRFGQLNLEEAEATVSSFKQLRLEEAEAAVSSFNQINLAEAQAAMNSFKQLKEEAEAVMNSFKQLKEEAEGAVGADSRPSADWSMGNSVGTPMDSMSSMDSMNPMDIMDTMAPMESMNSPKENLKQEMDGFGQENPVSWTDDLLDAVPAASPNVPDEDIFDVNKLFGEMDKALSAFPKQKQPKENSVDDLLGGDLFGEPRKEEVSFGKKTRQDEKSFGGGFTGLGSRLSGKGASEGREYSRNEQILALHDQGKSTVAIAKELGLGVGEVKLVIDLYKNA